jgi:muconolactone D-isomerase
VEFLVEFDVTIPPGAAESEIERREHAEALAAADLVAQGRLVRLWKHPGVTAVGLYRADSPAELDGLLAALPLFDWMDVTVTALESHPNVPPAHGEPRDRGAGSDAGNRLPDPQLTLVYRLEATLGDPLDLGEVTQGHRRIVPQTDGTVVGPEISRAAPRGQRRPADRPA